MESKVLRQSFLPLCITAKMVRVMKLTTVLLVVFCLQLSSKGLSQDRLTLEFKGASLETVLKAIKQQTGYQYVSSEQWPDNLPKITISFKEASLAEVLDYCFKNLPLTYTIVDKAIVIKKKAPPASPVKESAGPPDQGPPPGELINIHGRITDSTGTPLNGAFVQVEGSNKVTTTDEDGVFKLKGVDTKSALVISFVGYGTRRVMLGGKGEVNVTLKVTDKELAQVMVGYNSGFQKIAPERTTGSYDLMTNQQFNREVSPDVLSRLEGNMAGVYFNHNTAAALSSSDINIRGHGTLFSNDQPLIVVDNFAYDGSLQNINPNDVESITILKDAGAASIWGVRSGNGVIVITTKHAARGQKLAVEINSNITVIEKPNLDYNPNFLDAATYIGIEQNLFDSSYYKSALSRPFTLVSPAINIFALEQSGKLSQSAGDAQIETLKGVDDRTQLSKYFYRRAVAQQYSADVHGGGSNSDYYFSFGYDNALNSLVGNSNNRITLTSNYNVYPVKNLQMNFGINYIQSNGKTNSTLGNVSNLYPYTQVADQNGNPLTVSTDFLQNYKDSLTNLGFLNWQYKPLSEMNLLDNRNRTIDNLIKTGLKYDFLPGLSLELRYQYEKSSITQSNIYSDSTYYARNLINLYTQRSGGSFSYPVPIGGIYLLSNGYLTSNQARGQLNFNHDWNVDNQVTALAGAEVRQAINEGNSSSAYGYDSETGSAIPTINYATSFALTPSGSSRIPNNVSFTKTTNNFVSYFGNAAYIFKQRYTASISGRIDRSNLFGVSTNQKAVPLYSAGLAWEPSKESFYHVKWLPYLRLRSTFGYNGNINTSATAVLTIQQAVGAPYTGGTFANVANPGNPNLRWEKDRMMNFGADFASKNRRIAGSVEYYLKEGINLFGNSPIPPSVSGLPTFFGNVANTTGRGFDLTLNSINISMKKFRWTTNLLLSHAVDKVKKYDAKATAQSVLFYGNGFSAVSVVPIVGRDVFGIYSYKFAGLSHNNGDPEGYLNGKMSTDYTSMLGIASVDSLFYNGPVRPTYFGSIRNSFSYGPVTLSFNVVFKAHYYFRRNSMSDVGPIANGAPGNRDYYKRWQKPGDEAFTNVPFMQYPPFNTNREVFYQYSSVLVDKGDHVRFQDISVNYDLPQLGKGTNGLRLQVYGYMNNIGIIWRANKDKLDPDINSGAYLNPKSLSLGVRANF